MLFQYVYRWLSASTYVAVIFFLTAVSISELAIGQTQPAVTDPAYALQGEYQKGEQGIQVAALGEDVFRVSVFNGGLPGAGWNRTAIQVQELSLDEVEDFLKDSAIKKITRSSPTLEAAPPSSAVVLFDGSESSLKKHWADGAKLADGKYLQAGATGLDKFQSYRLHLEFRTPWMPKASGQGRGNSGVYHQGCYETQVLDSFGFDNEGNTCGAIYGVKPADFNAGLPPMVWQTYDVEFTAPSWNAAGQKTSNARLTVWLNGMLIHRDTEAPGPTTAAPLKEFADGGPIYLQDHGNPVQYRNIWVLPLDASAKSLRPRVPGFERFATIVSSADEVAEAGRLLIGELACQNCHKIPSVDGLVTPKEAPLLASAGSRLRLSYFSEMLASPHQSKPGTTMPDLLHGGSEADKKQTLEKLTAFLSTSGKSRHNARITDENAKRGEELFGKIGCAVCHGYPDGRMVTATSVPLPDLSKKYVWDGLTSFLKNPHSVRPAGRMPAMHLNDEEIRDLASYLLKGSEPTPSNPNVQFKTYLGNWNNLPEFEKLQPASEGKCEGFDLTVAGQTNNFAVRFDGYIKILKEGLYRFHLGSDDGSRLLIDGKVVVDVDGIHPHQTRSGEIALSEGAHRVQVDYFQGGGERTLQLDFEGPNLGLQSIEGWLLLDPNSKQVIAEQSYDPAMIREGSSLFGELGCVKCHQWEGISASLVMKDLPAVETSNMQRGCLSKQPAPNAPNYRLTDFQREAIVAAIGRKQWDTSAESTSQHIMAKLNCVACHARNQWGGPEADKLELFTSTTPEMGEEGRLPPLLTGVGDKLTEGYLNQVLRQGDRQRPYMLVRMPQFGEAAKDLASHWIKTDLVAEENPKATTDASEEAEFRLLAAGRQLSGIKGLACVQCHTFGGERALGIQAINLLTMTQRLRESWFRRYMLEPTRYRPGTRMPASFPEGKSVLTSVFDGDADRQIHALWKYLEQGNRAATPEGLQRNQIILEPKDRPIIYRNFFESMSARGIAVGYPGGLNLAWDAETMNMALIWHGQFMDASMHWRDRGVGRQRPLGDHVLLLEKNAPIALLEKEDSPWPQSTQKTEGYYFQGYRLNAKGEPSFRYRLGDIEVLDFPTSIAKNQTEPALQRTLTLSDKSTSAGKQNCYVRLGIGNKIDPAGDGRWKVDNRFEIRVPANLASAVAIRPSEGKQELMVTVGKLSANAKEISYEIHW